MTSSVYFRFKRQLMAKIVPGNKRTQTRKLPIAEAFARFVDSKHGVNSPSNIGTRHVHEFYEQYKQDKPRSLATLEDDRRAIEYFFEVMGLTFTIPKPQERHVNTRLAKLEATKQRRDQKKSP